MPDLITHLPHPLSVPPGQIEIGSGFTVSSLSGKIMCTSSTLSLQYTLPPPPALFTARLDFYQRAKSVYAVIHTLDDVPYGCFILQKGVIFK